MYIIQKSETFSDQLELKSADGKSLVLDIRLNISSDIVGKYRALQVRLMDLQKRTTANPGDPDIVEQVGRAVWDLLTLLFGIENCEKMVDFYDRDFITMLADVFPYIREVIAPKFGDLAKARRAQFKRRFK